KSNLNEQQWVDVRTKRFKNWFGDWENETENKASKEKIEQLLKAHKDTSKGVQREIIGRITSEQAEVLENDLGINPNGYTHTIEKSMINHTINNHGNERIEAQRGQLAVTEEDFTKIPEVLNNPDKIEYSGKNDKGLDTIKYTKAFNGTTIIVEEVRTGKKELAFNTMYKHKTGSEQLNKPSLLTSETTSKGKDTKNNVSKVVDANGEPIPVFHKTNAKKRFNIFNTKNAPSWFTPTKGYAEAFGTKKGKVYEAFINVKNPLYVGGIDGIANEKSLNSLSEVSGISIEVLKDILKESNGVNIFNITNSERFKNLLAKKGYDAIEANEAKGLTTFGVFSPNQIKSATDNVGTFSNESNDIRFSISSGGGKELTEEERQEIKEDLKLGIRLGNTVEEITQMYAETDDLDISEKDFKTILKEAQDEIEAENNKGKQADEQETTTKEKDTTEKDSGKKMKTFAYNRVFKGDFPQELKDALKEHNLEHETVIQDLENNLNSPFHSVLN
ncbi:MAG TPA: hypothetical protein PK075_02930, partial [Chitinophagales bacterium]|nr:hypothetical protein [Chitinophagales bacterium]